MINNALLYCGLFRCRGLNKVFVPKNYDKVYGFEPNPKLFSEAKKKYKKYGKVTILPYALGAETGFSDFYIFNRPASSSLSKLSPEWIEHWKKKRGQDVEVANKIKVKVYNLYEWAEEEGIGHIKFLITDLQGIDFTVLQSMRPMFEKGLIDKVRAEAEYNDCASAYPDIPSNKKALFDEFFKDLPYTQVAGPSRKWKFNKAGTHQDCTWALD